jgi:DUF2892 family protein
MLERTIRAIAGSFILLSLALGYFFNPMWYLFTAFVGLNLIQSAFTKWCLMEDILRSTIFRKQLYLGHDKGELVPTEERG